jgi:hypothetical protein
MPTLKPFREFDSGEVVNFLSVYSSEMPRGGLVTGSYNINLDRPCCLHFSGRLTGIEDKNKCLLW